MTWQINAQRWNLKRIVAGIVKREAERSCYRPLEANLIKGLMRRRIFLNHMIKDLIVVGPCLGARRVIVCHLADFDSLFGITLRKTAESVVPDMLIGRLLTIGVL